MCLHSKTEIVQTPELKHYGKRVCSDCGKFITWVKSPDKAIRENCKHQNSKVELTPESHRHYGQKVCCDCGKWLKWIADPVLDDETEERNRNIDKLLAYGNIIPAFDQSFMRGIRKQRLLTPKQKVCWNKIREKYFKESDSDEYFDSDDYSQFNY